MKKRITLLFGGRSTEHAISCRSAKTFIDNIDREKYQLTTVGITKDGQWLLYDGPSCAIADGSWLMEKNTPLYLSLGGELRGLFIMENSAMRAIETDVFLPVLHGKNGEDGTIQGLFEMLDIPYVGCGVAASANAMDKLLTKHLVSDIGIDQARYVAVDRYSAADLDAVIARCEDTLGYPMFVKPCASGSSIGITKATDKASLRRGIAEALLHDSRILIEEFINARELECAVMDDGSRLYTQVGEVISADDFYDFDAKYNNAASVTEISPSLPEGLEQQICRAAKEIFRVLDCRSLSRIDFFLDKDTGRLIFNEINTLPGFTPISMYPMLAAKQGLSLPALIDLLIGSAAR